MIAFMPSLFGLVLLSFVCGAVSALATRRRGAAFMGMVAALAAGSTAPWAAGLLGWRIDPVWSVLAASITAALLVAALTALRPRRH